MKFSFEQYKEQYMKLSPDIQDALSSVAISEAIYETGKDYGLRIDQLDVLGQQVTLVLLGTTHPKDFISRLKSTLPQPITNQQIQDVAQDINELVFEPVRQSILHIHHTTPAVISPQKIVFPSATPAVQPQPSVAPTQAVPPPTPSVAPQPQGITRTLPADIAQTKLEQSFRMAPTTTTVKEGMPVVPKQTDPYREAVE